MPKKRKPKKAGSPRRRNSIMSRVFLMANLGAVLLLLASFLSSYVSPEWSIIPAFLGLAYPFIALINLGFVLLWLILFRAYFLISLLALLLGYGQFIRHFQFHYSKAEDLPADQVRVMTYNVRMFDFFDWKGDPQAMEEILGSVEEVSPDILCIQEFYNNKADRNNIRRQIQAAGSFEADHIAYKTERKGHAYGIATFSRFPIIHREEIPLPDPSTPALLTDVLYGEDTLRIFNLHLVSYYFAQDDYFFFERLVSEQDTRDFKKASLSVLSKLKKGFIIRARQAHILRKHIEASPHPVIICGDFNDTPASYAYRTLRKGMQDAFMQAGRGMGRTYKGTFPSYRIDYTLHSPDLITHSIRTLGSGGSDHRAVVSILHKE